MTLWDEIQTIEDAVSGAWNKTGIDAALLAQSSVLKRYCTENTTFYALGMDKPVQGLDAVTAVYANTRRHAEGSMLKQAVRDVHERPDGTIVAFVESVMITGQEHQVRSAMLSFVRMPDGRLLLKHNMAL